MAKEEVQNVQTTKTGFVYQSLARSNKQIRQERGDAIAEDLEMTYKREVEDLAMSLRRLKRDRDNMFDFSPTNSQSLVMAKNLESADIKEKDLQITMEIRNTTIKYDLAVDRYVNLFGAL